MNQFRINFGGVRERVVNSTRGSMEEVIIQGLQPGSTYVVRVVAHNLFGPGESSSPIRVSGTHPILGVFDATQICHNVSKTQVTTQEDVEVPGPVTGLAARPTSAFSILISWQHPAYRSETVTVYKLYYRRDDYTSETKSVTLKETQFHLTELREFTDYTFWVSAFNDMGEGALSEEVSARTYSDVPADPPQNVTLEADSSRSIIVRWEPPPRESQNGVITGYKLRWRRGKGSRSSAAAASVGKSEVVTTDGGRRLYAISDLRRGTEYQVKISALTVNGSGPATPWLSQVTFESDLDESVVPDPPSWLRAEATDDSITIAWKPPKDNKILVRGYTIGWGKGIPDEYTKLVDDKQRFFVIGNLGSNPSQYHL